MSGNTYLGIGQEEFEPPKAMVEEKSDLFRRLLGKSASWEQSQANLSRITEPPNATERGVVPDFASDSDSDPQHPTRRSEQESDLKSAPESEPGSHLELELQPEF